MGPSLIIKFPLPESMGGIKRESSTAPAELPSRRPVRSTRTQVPTYNNAILAGTALHTPTKYLEKHHKNVLHGPLVSMAPEPSRKRKVGPGPSALQQSTTPTYEDAGKGKIRGSRGVYVKKTKEIAAAVAASSPVQNATEPSPSITEEVNSEPPLTSYRDSPVLQPIAAAPPKFHAANPSPPTSAWQNSKPSLPEYLDSSIWQRFTKTAVITVSKAVQCLGINPKHGNRGIVFPHPVQQSLSTDIDAIATKLYAQLPADELVRCAADSNYLNKELDIILDTYALDIWSIDADRAGMLEAGEENAYEENLVYEYDDDRRLLWIYLHRWVFVRSFELLRKQGGDADVRKGVLEALEQRGDAFTAPVEEELQPRTGRKLKAPEETNTLRKYKTPTTAEPIDFTSLRDVADGQVRYASSTEAWGILAEITSLIQAKGALKALGQRGDAFTAPDEEELQPQPQPRTGRKRKAPQEIQVSRKRKAPATSEALTNAFLEYLSGFGKQGFMPDTSLKNLKRTLYKVATSLPDILAGHPAADSFAHILAAWITYQQTILDVLTAHGHTPSLGLLPTTLKIKNSRLLTELRKARDDFVTSGMRVEDVLVEGFGALQSPVAEAQKVESETKNRFGKLDKGLMKLGDELKEGGGDWVLMGPSRCPIVLVKTEGG